jgi:hypothetical protein
MPIFAPNRFITAALFALAAAGGASAQTVQVNYQISLAGLSIGTANLRASMDGSKYNLAVSAKLTGLAGAIAGGGGSGTASGGLSAVKPLPGAFQLTTSNGKETRMVRMILAAGTVKTADITPPIKDADAPDRVPLQPAHRVGVVDPVSALIFPVAGKAAAPGPQACARRIPVFDGAARFDVAFEFKGTREVAGGQGGYTGPVIVCAARYHPIAGHRTTRSGTKFMAANKDIEVWLAPVGERAMLPYRIAVRTPVGMSTIQAASFTVGQTTAKAQGN